MTPLAFFRSPEAQRVLHRAARVTGCAISLHTIREGQESPRVLTIGGCDACTLVAQLPDGREACRLSRAPHAARTLKRGVPAPFLCHMGLACVSIAPFAGEDESYVLTIGPYCPSAGILSEDAAPLMRALGDEASKRLRKLGADETELPTFEDVPVSSADAVPAVAQWLAESLRALRHASARDEESTALETPLSSDARGRARGKSRRPDSDPYGASAIAAAVIAGNRSRLRRLIQIALGESRAPRRGGREARAMIVAAAGLEALDCAGTEVQAPLDKLAALAESLDDVPPEEWPALLARFVLNASGYNEARRGALIANVDHVLSERLADRITLNEVARQVGCTPSAVTHALQRKFRMSFTQYLGRLRVAAAKELLRRTRLSPLEIAQRIGIQDPSNFARLFKKFENVTPIEYRKRCGEK